LVVAGFLKKTTEIIVCLWCYTTSI